MSNNWVSRAMPRLMVGAAAALVGCCHLLQAPPFETADAARQPNWKIERPDPYVHARARRQAMATPTNPVELLLARCAAADRDNLQLALTPDGYVEAMAFPGHGVLMGLTPGDTPEKAARKFFEQNAAAFGVAHRRIAWTTGRVFPAETHIMAHLHQTIDGIPVLGSDARIQYRPDGAVFDVATRAVRDNAVARAQQRFRLSRDEALAIAAREEATADNATGIAGPRTAEKVWFVPALMKTGPSDIPLPAWHARLGGGEYYLHADTGEILLRAPMVYPVAPF